MLSHSHVSEVKHKAETSVFYDVNFFVRKF